MLNPGSRLGPYRILAPLGAGGMGEVYRAHDPRLDRDVAIKVLPEHLSSDAEALARFEREAKVVAGLSHPNITALFDIGRDGGAAYAVMELLEGESLRTRLAHGAMPARKVVELGIQMAHGLAAAHGRGILHRDLKPDNLWITKEGRIKILDFGLAKVVQSPFTESGADEPTVALDSAPPTKAGVVLGTVGYMSPEQVRGQAVDPRSDLFSLGVVLWEMLAGQRPFQGDSAIETLHAILTQEPQTLPPGLELPPELVRILDHCLQKNPDARFQTARDLGFALENLSNPSASRIPLPAGRKPFSWKAGLLAAGMTGLLAGGGLVYATRPPRSIPTFHRITFETGTVRSARFAKDGQTILFSAQWSGSRAGLYLTRAGSTEARSLDLGGADLLAISPKDEVAVLLEPHELPGYLFLRPGRLAVAQLAGGSPLRMLDRILAADWSPDGTRMAVVREAGEECSLECPAGTVLEKGRWRYLNPRFSPDGRMLAFLRMPINASEGRVSLYDFQSGKARDLTGPIVSLGGLSWHPGGKEVWYTTFSDAEGNLRAVDLKGRVRIVAAIPDDLSLQDVASDGRALLIHGTLRKGLLAQTEPAAPFEEIGKYKWSGLVSLSNDGRQVATMEDPLEKGHDISMYLHALDRPGSEFQPLDPHEWIGFSADSRNILFCDYRKDGSRITVRPLDGGADTVLTGPAGKFLLPVSATDRAAICIVYERDLPPKLTLEPLDGSAPVELAELPECKDPLDCWYLTDASGTRFIYGSPTKGFHMIPLRPGGKAVPVPHLGKGECVVQWGQDGNSVFLSTTGAPPLSVQRMDLATGARTPVRSVDPPGTAQDRLSYAYLDQTGKKALVVSFYRSRTSLYVVDGLR